MENNLLAVINLKATFNEENLKPIVKPYIDGETIQIGIVLLDRNTMTCISTFETRVKPNIMGFVTPSCTDLTGISKESLKNAPRFEEALQDIDNWLRSFTHKKVLWCDWGWFDAKQIEADCLRNSNLACSHELPIKSLGIHFNLKKMFAKQDKLGHESKRTLKYLSLKGALWLCGMEFEGKEHNALVDAKNTARLITSGHLTINDKEIEFYSKRSAPPFQLVEKSDEIPFEAVEPDKDKYFVIDISEHQYDVDLAIIGQGENADSDNCLRGLATEKVKGAPHSFGVTIKELEKLSRYSPNMAEYIKTVVSQLKTHDRFSVSKPLRFAPTLLVGPPGCGKTYIATKIAEAMDIWHGNISLSLATESFVLSGCPKGYGSSNPGDIARRMAKSDCINPLLILDELDKACFDLKDRPSLTGPLLQILEADTAVQFEDACLKCELDVSHVSWLATANDIGQVPEPILSRFNVIHVQEAKDDAKVRQILHLVPSVVVGMGLGGHITAEITSETVERYLGLSVRDWKMKLQLAIAMKASDNDSGNHIVIQAEDMQTLIYKKKEPRMGFI